MLKYYIEEHKDDVLFQRNSYHRFIYVAIFLLIINYCIVGLMYYKLLTIKMPPNFATTSDGRLINIILNNSGLRSHCSRHLENLEFAEA